MTRNGGAITLAPAKADDFYCGARFLIKLPTPEGARARPRRSAPSLSAAPLIHFPKGRYVAQNAHPLKRLSARLQLRPSRNARERLLRWTCVAQSGEVHMSVVTPVARTQSIAFLSSGAKEANEALERLTALYGNSPLDEADVIVALGGDGLMLQTLHMTMKAPKPIYGMNRGSVGFLMNDYSEHGLPRAARGGAAVDHPSAHHARARHQRGRDDGAGDQRGVAAAPDLSGGQAAHRDRRQDAARRTDRRRHPGLHARRLDRLQPFRQRADPAARRAADGADAALAVSPPSLARRAAAGFRSA